MAGLFGKVKEFFLNYKTAAAVLVAACFFVYANALDNSFVWDDEEQVVNNTVIRDWGNSGLIFTSSTFYAGGAGLSGGFYRPLVTLSYFWNYMYWGLNPFGYHLMQLLFHCANTFLVFYLLAALFKMNGILFGREAALIAALFFAVHPANVESVAYVGSIGETVYAFFGLLAMVIFTGSIGKSGDISKTKLFWLSFLLIFLGLLAKETAIIFLPLMLAYILLFAKPRPVLFVKFAAGCALAVSPYLFLRLRVANIDTIPEHYAPIYLAPLWQRLLTVPQEIVSYLEIIFFPRYLSISRHYLVTDAGDPRFWQSLAFLVIAAAAMLFYIAKNSSKIFIFFTLWFVITLGPVLNIIPLDMTIAERWLYIPVVGLISAVCLIVIGFWGKAGFLQRRVIAVFIAAIFFLFCARTVARNSDWQNGLALYGRDISMAARLSPAGSFDLENNYGVELFRAGRYDEAGDHFKRSIALQPKWASSQNNLGAVLERRGDFEGALTQYRIAADMGYYRSYENVAALLIKSQKKDEAKFFLEASLLKLPENVKLQYYLALVYAADNVENESGSKNKAAYLLENILRSDPQNEPAAQLLWMLQNNRRIEL